MSVHKNPDPNQMLIELARNEGPDVVHLPYSREFEALCSQIKPRATTQDKHKIWERLLELGASEDEPAAAPAQAPVPPTAEASSAARISRRPDESGLLFPAEPPIPEMQPWALPPKSELSPEDAEKRDQLLADIANSHLATREQRVARILERYPETRDSDTALCLRYWRTFQADVIERWQPLELDILFDLDRIETLGRARRFIQNDLRLFQSTEGTRKARGAMQHELHEYVVAHQALPEIRFYLDETGNEGDKTYTGVAGVCVINWKQYEKHHAALEQ